MSQFTNFYLKSGMNIVALGYTKHLYGRCSNEARSGVVVGEGTVADEISPGGPWNRPDIHEQADRRQHSELPRLPLEPLHHRGLSEYAYGFYFDKPYIFLILHYQ
jgi:hypothetical protein